MKKTVLFLLWLTSSLVVSAQRNAKVESMASLGEIWGFLKYYHPNIAGGQTDWDSVLVADLPILAKNPSSEQFQAIVGRWLSDAGPISLRKSYLEIEIDSSLGNFDLSFLEENPLLNESLKAQLKYIRDNRFQGKQYYALPSSWNGPISFENEEPYSEELYPTQPYRMLALFRYWNAIHYYFPYKYLIEEDWRETLREFTMDFYEAEDQLAYHLSIRKLSARIYDTHSFLHSTTWDYSQGKYRLLASVKLIEGKSVIMRVIADSLGERYPLERGDVVLSVNRISTDSIRERLHPYLLSSNEVTTQRKISNWLLVVPSKKVVIEIERNGKEMLFVLNAVHVKQFHKLASADTPSDSVPKWVKRNDNIGYVDMGRLEREEVGEMMKELMDCKAIIFDVRNYPKGTYRHIMMYLLPSRSPFATFSYPETDYPGKFSRYTEPYYVGKRKNKKYYQGKVVVLQDESTQSHAEFTIMALQTSPNCTLIGSQTAGADGNVTTIKLPGGALIYFTGIGVYYPDMRETQRIGIVPNVERKPTLEGIRTGKDEVLETALELINNEKI
ncbi:MAG: S41 family peptidase [Bacteroidia bacterium]